MVGERPKPVLYVVTTKLHKNYELAACRVSFPTRPSLEV